MYKIGVVIVHYKTVEDTLSCITSLFQNVKDIAKVCVTVVFNEENKNSSFFYLKEKLQNYENIFLIETHKNLGYARGCNEGIEFLRSKKRCDFVIAMNNDILVQQKDLISCLQILYEKYHYAIAGPEILDLNGDITPNYPIKNYGIFRLRVGQVAIGLRYIASFLHADLLISYVLSLRHNRNVKQEYANKDIIDIPLQGCFLIFSPEYFKQYNGFCKDTFLYLEEDILFLRCQRKSLRTVYSPSLQITHIGGASTDQKDKNAVQKRRNKYKAMLSSTNVLIHEIIENGRKT
ncbi:glycosyltransferase [Bacillota bacterium LCP21S3_G6]